MPEVAVSRSRLGRVMRRAAGLSPRQWGLLSMMVASLVAGAVAAGVLLGRPGASAAIPVAGPPLDNPALSRAVTPAASPATPVTVRLIVPAGHIDIPVIEGDGVHVPLARAMHYPGTGQPGGDSTSLFYAHARPGMFRGLWDLHAGDAIRAVRSDGTVIQYRVHEIRRVPWNDLDILRPTQFEQIILLTCTTYSPYDPRYIVTGDL